jgi:hypothetical protein
MTNAAAEIKALRAQMIVLARQAKKIAKAEAKRLENASDIEGEINGQPWEDSMTSFADNWDDVIAMIKEA